MTTQGSTTEPMDKLLICPICQREMNEAKILSCLHTYCKTCLENSLSKSGIANGQGFLCPLCKIQSQVPNRGVAAMKDDILSASIQEFKDRRAVDPNQTCEGCETGSRIRRKCLDCNDWLCNQCCDMHKKVRATRDHQLVAIEDIRNGKFDSYIKESMEALLCGRHQEPLQLFCTHPSCQAPICTMCKSTLGHDTHITVELGYQAQLDKQEVNALLRAMEPTLTATNAKISNLQREEKATSQARKQVHKMISERTEQVVNFVVKQIQQYAEELHQEVEGNIKTHKHDVKRALDEHNNNLQGILVCKQYTTALLDFDRTEELVVMSKDVKAALKRFQVPPDTGVPQWRQPRLQPSDTLPTEHISKLFGGLTFEGEIVKCTSVKSFIANAEGDDKVCALCDVTMSKNNNIIVVDRDNRRIKIFDLFGNLKVAISSKALKSPNRIVYLWQQGQFLVKDDKSLKVLDKAGEFVTNFGMNLRQPVGMCLTDDGLVYVTDWMSESVHVFTSDKGEHVRQFLIACEAPGYICVTTCGNVALTDWKQNIMKVFSPTGNLITQHGGTQGSAPDQLDHPYGICADKHGQILLADTWNNRVLLFHEDGKMLKVLLGKDDGLQWPQALTVTNEGFLVVVEQHGNIKLFQYMA